MKRFFDAVIAYCHASGQVSARSSQTIRLTVETKAGLVWIDFEEGDAVWAAATAVMGRAVPTELRATARSIVDTFNQRAIAQDSLTFSETLTLDAQTGAVSHRQRVLAALAEEDPDFVDDMVVDAMMALDPIIELCAGAEANTDD